MSLKRKAIAGLALVTASTYFWKIIDFVSTIILARILSPETFGTVSTAIFILFFLALFPGFGTGQALIQRKGDIKKAADTVFIMAPVLSLLMAGALWLIAPFIGAFYNSSELTFFLRLLSPAIFFDALGIAPESLLEKELDYVKKVIPELVAPVMMSIVSVILAFRGYGGKSIIIGYLVMYFVQSALTWMLSPYRPSLSFDWKIAKELLSYGKSVVLFYTMTYFIQYLSYGIVAKVLGLAIVGYFAIADKFSTLVVKNITKIVNRITLPVFSKLQDNERELRANFIRVVEYTSFLVIPANLALFILGEEVIRILYGDKWLASVGILQIVIFSGIFLGIAGTTTSVFFSKGKPHLLTRINFLQALLLAILLYPAARFYGITGVAAVIVLSSLVNFVMSFISMGYMLKITPGMLIRENTYIFISALAMCLVIGLFRELVPIHDIPGLAMIMLLGLLSYLGAVFILNRRFYKRLIREAFAYLKI